MSVEKAKEFLLSLKEKAPDEAFIEKWKSAKTEDDQMQLYIEIAGSMGYDLSAAEVKEAASELEAEHRAKTLAVEQELRALDDDELENVAGGEDDFCFANHDDTPCLVCDVCDTLMAYYGN